MKLIHESNYSYAEPGTKVRSYDDDHYKLLESYEGKEIGEAITKNRIKMVKGVFKKMTHKSLLDYGCGSGYFIKELAKKTKLNTIYGYDVLEKTTDWLKGKGIYYDLEKEDQELYPLGCITMWDVIEHLPEPRKVLDKIKKGTYLLISVPLTNNLSKLKEWKHYRPYEHLHYWTYVGFVEYMIKAGFKLLDRNYNETLAGREDIWSFTFIKE